MLGYVSTSTPYVRYKHAAIERGKLFPIHVTRRCRVKRRNGGVDVTKIKLKELQPEENQQNSWRSSGVVVDGSVRCDERKIKLYLQNRTEQCARWYSWYSWVYV